MCHCVVVTEVHDKRGGVEEACARKNGFQSTIYDILQLICLGKLNERMSVNVEAM